MSLITLAYAIALWAATLAVLVFGASYSTVKWEKSPEGRNVMALTVSLALLLTSRLINFLTDWDVITDWIRVAALLGVALCMAWRTLIFFRSRRNNKH